jgi:mannose-6-phosphate isomerase-like protein (cupin superfamily)
MNAAMPVSRPNGDERADDELGQATAPYDARIHSHAPSATGFQHSRALGDSNAPACETLRELLYFGGDEVFASKSMKAIQGYHLIKPEDLFWRPSNLMRIPNTDYLERTGSENMGARLWRLPPKSANTLHRHIRAEEFYFVLEGTGRLRVSDETLTVPKYGGVLVWPDQLRQVFNDTDTEVLWLIVGAPEELEFLPSAKTKPDMSLIYPVDPKQLPKELAGVEWPPKG